MGFPAFDRLLDPFNSASLFLVLLWVGLAALAIGLAVLMYTRWGQIHPLSKSMALSVLAHALLAGFSTTLCMAPSIPLLRDEIIHVSLSDRPTDARRGGQTAVAGSATGTGKPGDSARHFKARPWEAFGQEPKVQPAPTQLARLEPADMRGLERQPGSQESGLAGTLSLEKLPLAEAVQPQPEPLSPVEKTPAATKRVTSGQVAGSAAPIQVPAAQRRESTRTSLPGPTQVARHSATESTPSEPVRRSQAGLPKKLLERTVALPRLDDVPVAADPDKTLPAAAGQAANDGRLRPVRPAGPSAPATGGQVAGMPADAPTGESAPGMGSTGPRGAAGGAPSTGPATAETGHLRPPSIAARGSGTAGPGGTGSGPGGEGSRIGPPQMPGRPYGRPDQRLPDTYRLRVAPDRERLAERHGATPETEAAVQAALKWLSSSQRPDGHWHPKEFGAGREAKVAHHDRYGAGATADTGLTGLATLTFLAAGSTHLEGSYQATTRRALEYLLRSQGADGNLAGDSAVYEFMYCHGMAAIALSEAYGMTKDARLREPVRRAIAYTIAAQDPVGGGWRYRNQEAGDTSQLGWQLMALKSAELAGIAIPNETWQAVERFLRSASSGTHGGLASYRPNEEVSRTMTAEALMCRQFLGLPPESPTAREAGNYVLGELPGERQADAYYWYYGTLAMHEMGGVHWQRWNDAMKNTLPALQIKSGPLAGSWDPDALWGNYGGRIYSTALATLCLEIYYRYLPLSEASSQARPPK